jgi:hypothetical protein
MWSTACFEASVTKYQATLRNITEERSGSLKSRMLKRLFGPKRSEIKAQRIKLRNEEINNFDTFPVLRMQHEVSRIELRTISLEMLHLH